MTDRAPVSQVETELALRIAVGGGLGALARALKLLHAHGEANLVSVVRGGDGRAAGLLLCPNCIEGALALRREGFEVETETVVTVRTPDLPGAFAHFVATLEAENLRIAYAFSLAAGGEILAVFRTDENPKAEDALRNYLFLPDITLPAGGEAAPPQPA